MKLVNILSVAALGTLFVVGCSSTTTTTTTDGGRNETGTDAGGDTASNTDTGGTSDTGSDSASEQTCTECTASKCATEVSACQASQAAADGCNAVITCMNACTDADCQNTCINNGSSEGKALVGCILSDCQAECTSGS